MLLEMRSRLLRLLLLFLVASILGAQTPATPPVLQVPAAAQAGPGFDPVIATKAYLATVPPDKKARSDAYFEGGYWLTLWNFLCTAAICLLLLGTRLSARMRDLSERVTRRKPLQTWLYWAEYLIVVFVLGFPLSVYQEY